MRQSRAFRGDLQRPPEPGACRRRAVELVVDGAGVVHDAWVAYDSDGTSATRSRRTVVIRPSRRDGFAMNAVGLLVTAFGLGVFAALAIAGSATDSFTMGGLDLLLGLLGMTAAVVVLALTHEALHGLAMLTLQARPTFGVGITGGGLVPYVHTTASGHLFNRTEYVVVALTPTFALNLLMVVLVGWGPMGGWLVLPAAIHLGGCVGDWWLAAQVARHPTRCRYEDLKDGLRAHMA